MKILISGSNGMIGSAAARYLATQGHQVTRLVRGKPAAGEVFWDPDGGEIDAAGIEGFDGVVNLASRAWPARWTPAAKGAMRANRLAANGLLARALSACSRKPQVFVCASGMGIYAPAGDSVIDEESPLGADFLAGLQKDGEAAAQNAAAAGIRVVNLRIPMVVGGEAARRKVGRLGDGRQWCSWVGRDELAGIIDFILTHGNVAGPVNPVSPNPLRAAEFASVAACVHGAAGPALPAWVLRLMMGEMAEALILASRRIQPRRLQEAGYVFRFPELDGALRHELGLN